MTFSNNSVSALLRLVANLILKEENLHLPLFQSVPPSISIHLTPSINLRVEAVTFSNFLFVAAEKTF